MQRYRLEVTVETEHPQLLPRIALVVQRTLQGMQDARGRIIRTCWKKGVPKFAPPDPRLRYEETYLDDQT